jgi:hypothetical protein
MLASAHPTATMNVHDEWKRFPGWCFGIVNIKSLRRIAILDIRYIKLPGDSRGEFDFGFWFVLRFVLGNR